LAGIGTWVMASMLPRIPGTAHQIIGGSDKIHMIG
jgi:hypothetical protein